MRLFSEYCQALFELSAKIEVTDRDNLSISLDEGAKNVVEMLEGLQGKCRKVMLLGNGGSAAIAGHMHNDLSKGAGIRSLAFQDVSLLTAMANDHGYAVVYESGVAQWAEEGDLLISISSSGESENMLLAVRAAQEVNCDVVTMTGFNKKNSLRKQGDINFYIPVSDYGYVETLHSLLAHYLTDMAQEQS